MSSSVHKKNPKNRSNSDAIVARSNYLGRSVLIVERDAKINSQEADRDPI